MFKRTGLIALNRSGSYSPRLAAIEFEEFRSIPRPLAAGLLIISTALSDFCEFVGHIALAFPRFVAYPKQSLEYISSELYYSGVNSVLTVCIVAFLFGTVIVAISGAQFQTLGLEIYVANLIGIALARDLATLLTSICLLFLATARFTDDIASKRHLNKNVYVLCLSRTIVLFFLTPILSLFAFYSALLGGAITANQQFNITWYQYWDQISTAVSFGNLCFGLFKAMIFGIEIALIGCFYGIICRDKRKTLGRGIIASITMGIFLVAFTDSFIELLTY